MNLFTALGLIFITLKLTHYVDWSWWVVLLPLYGGIVLYFLLFGIAFIAAGSR